MCDAPKREEPAPAVSLTTVEGNLYKDPMGALKAVRDDYQYWTGKLTETSFQLSLAVIAANWAVFAKTETILQNWWALLSIGAVLITLGLNLLGARILGGLLRGRIRYAEKNAIRWDREFNESNSGANHFPYTKSIDNIAVVLRELKAWLPLLGGLSFLIALFRH
jgi:hypothetical protein